MPVFSPEQLERAVARELARPAYEAPAPTAAPSPKTGMSLAALLTFLGGQGADMGTTIHKLRQPGMRERNVLGPVGTLAAKGALMVALPLVTRKAPRTLADLLGYLDGGIGGAVAIHNLRQHPQER